MRPPAPLVLFIVSFWPLLPDLDRTAAKAADPVPRSAAGNQPRLDDSKHGIVTQVGGKNADLAEFERGALKGLTIGEALSVFRADGAFVGQLHVRIIKDSRAAGIFFGSGRIQKGDLVSRPLKILPPKHLAKAPASSGTDVAKVASPTQRTSRFRPSSSETESQRAAVPRSLSDKVSLDPTAAVDEQLFLLYILDSTYRQWPAMQSSTTDVTNWLASTRYYLTPVRDHAWTNVRSEIGILYDECLQRVEDYEHFLVSHQFIEKATDDQIQDSQMWLGIDLSVAGVSLLASGNVVGAAFSGLLALGKSLYDQDQIALAKLQLIENEVRGNQRRFNVTLAHLQEVSKQLAKQHQWDSADVDFMVPPAMRDHDPFAIMSQIRQRATKADLKAADYEDLTRNCQKASRLIPDKAPYRVFLASARHFAARLANQTCNLQIGGNYSGAPAPFAEEAIRLCQDAIDADPFEDAEQSGVCELARALGMAGRFEEALNMMQRTERRREDPFFMYRKARLLSLTGEVDRSLDALSLAFRCGYDDIVFARSDPDLDALRHERKQDFEDLTSISWQWNVVEDWFLHEVMLTNKSAFPLTNVKLIVRYKSGSTIQIATGTVPRINPGKTHAFHDMISGLKVEPISADLHCHGNP
jgi:tetratricopeptide (TPR) repeat protein